MVAETTSRLQREVVTTPVTKFATLICAQSAVAAPTDINWRSKSEIPTRTWDLIQVRGVIAAELYLHPKWLREDTHDALNVSTMCAVTASLRPLFEEDIHLIIEKVRQNN